MINFECSESNLKRAIFGGDITTITAEVDMMISLIYGGIKSENEDAAQAFKMGLIMSLIDGDASAQIFSSELYDATVGSKNFIAGSLSISDIDELVKQLKEIMDEDK